MIEFSFVSLINAEGIVDFLPQHPWIQNVYVEALVVVLFWILMSRIAQLLIQKVFLKLASRTRTDLDNKILHAIDGPLYLTMALFGISRGIDYLGWPWWIERIAYSGMVATLGVAVLRVINTIIRHFVESRLAGKESRTDETFLALLRRIISGLGWVILILFVFTLWGLEIGPFLAGLGIAGLALSFALQKSLEDIFGGISLTLDKNFKIGDAIELDNGVAGTVQDIGLRSTKIVNWDKEYVIVPNGKLAQMTFRNFAQPTHDVRGIVEFGVAYGTDPEKAINAALKVANDHPLVMKEPAASCRFITMGDFALTFRLFFYVEHYSDRFAVRHDLLIALYREFQREGIEIPFPTRTVYMKKDA
jgi:MscS family membrane protein